MIFCATLGVSLRFLGPQYVRPTRAADTQLGESSTHCCGTMVPLIDHQAQGIIGNNL